MATRGEAPRRPAVLLAMVLVATAGCGGRGPGGGSAGSRYAPPPEQALALTREALDAWASGTVHELGSREPPLRFVDPEQARGRILVAYEIPEGRERQYGPVVDVPVSLQVKDPKGKTQSILAIYQVATEPTQAVLRNDPD